MNDGYYNASGRTPEYKMATVFFGIALFFFLLTAVSFGYLRSYKPPSLHYEGVKDILVVKKNHSTFKTSSRGHTTTHHLYTAETVVVENGDSHKQTLDSSEYDTLEEGKVYSKPVYTTDDGHFFVSWDGIMSESEMTKLYYKRFPDAEIVSRRIVVMIPLVIMLMCLSTGLRLFRKHREIFSRSAVVQSAVSYEDILKWEREKGSD